jgi:hypothetical protein
MSSAYAERRIMPIGQLDREYARQFMLALSS